MRSEKWAHYERHFSGELAANAEQSYLVKCHSFKWTPPVRSYLLCGIARRCYKYHRLQVSVCME